MKKLRRTNIVGTIGPASQSEEKLTELMNAGLNVTRINFSHGGYEENAEKIDTIKKVRSALNRPVALVLDTKGPEIRTGKLESGDEKVVIEEGQTFTFLYDEVIGNNTKTSIGYKNLYQDVVPGAKILVDDGAIEFEVVRIEGKDVVCKALNTGRLGSRKTMNVPGVKLELPALTQKDIDDITEGIKRGFDYIAASFVRKAADVIAIRKLLNENGGENVKIISKIENQEGIDNFEEILELSDGIMVARGDMGVEIPMEEVPIVQKQLIKKCNTAGKIVITATQMLESMTINPRPTRAEVSDVANAIFDLTGAVMLSGESAMGKYPVQCVETMSRIAHSIEKQISYDKRIARRNLDFENMDYKFYLHHSISLTATKLGAKAIFAYTDAGNTPRIISSLLPTCPIIAVTTDEKTYRQLAIVADVIPLLINEKGEPRDIIEKGIEKAIELNLIQKGDVLAIAGGDKILPNSEASMNRTIGGIIKA